MRSSRSTRRLDLTLALLLGSVVLFLFSYTGAVVAVPLLAAEYDADPALVGAVVALPGFLGFLLAIPSAALSNRVGRRPVIAAGFVCLSLSGIGFVLAPGFQWLIPSQLAIGLAMILYWPSTLAAFSELAGHRSHEFIQGANTLSQGLAGFLGATVAASLTGLAGTGVAVIAILVAAIAGLALVSILEETSPRAARTPHWEVGAAARSAVRLLVADRYVGLGIYALLSWAMLWWVAGASFFVLHVTNIGHSAIFAGALLGLRIAVASILRLAFAPIARRLGLANLLIWGNAMAGIGLLLVLASDSAAVLTASAIIQGTGLALVLPASNVVVSLGTPPADRVVGLAMSASFNNLAILLSAPILGLAAASGGTHLGLALAGVIALAGSLLMLPWRAAKPSLPTRDEE